MRIENMKGLARLRAERNVASVRLLSGRDANSPRYYRRSRIPFKLNEFNMAQAGQDQKLRDLGSEAGLRLCVGGFDDIAGRKNVKGNPSTRVER